MGTTTGRTCLGSICLSSSTEALFAGKDSLTDGIFKNKMLLVLQPGPDGEYWLRYPS